MTKLSNKVKSKKKMSRNYDEKMWEFLRKVRRTQFRVCVDLTTRRTTNIVQSQFECTTKRNKKKHSNSVTKLVCLNVCECKNTMKQTSTCKAKRIGGKTKTWQSVNGWVKERRVDMKLKRRETKMKTKRNNKCKWK